MSDSAENREKETRVIYVIPHEGDTNLRLDSRYKYVIKHVAQSFMIDGHMHLQSLNCTPLQLQWATSYLRTHFSFLFISGSFGTTGDRKELTETTTGTGGFHLKTLVNMAVKALATKEFGDIGQFYTDSIGKLYLGRMEENSTRIALRWLIDANAKEEELNIGLSKKQNKQHDLAKGRNKSTSSFFDWPAASQYFSAKPLHMNIGHPMDLSYAHFWGIHRIPMYLNIPVMDDSGKNKIGEKFYFINDYRTINHVSGLFVSSANEGYHVEYEFDPLVNYFLEKLFSNEAPLTYNFPVEDEYVKFKLFYQMGNKNPQHRLAFSTDRFQAIIADDTLDKTSRAEALNRVFNDLDPYYSPKPSGPKYNHFLEEIPLDTIEIFEEYSQQISYYAATGFRFPLQFLPFYHFDPRRHFNDTTRDLIVPQIMREHRFSLLKESKGSPEVQGHGTMPSLTPAVALDEHYFSALFFEGKDEPHKWGGKARVVQAPYKKHINEAIYNVLPTEADQEKGKANPKIKFPPHLFWGVKMYPPLGYAPDLYNQCEERYDLPKKYYDHLKEFFKYCADAQIPITAHASPLGMSIGDGFNYILNDYEQRQKKGLSPTGGDKWYSWTKDGDGKNPGKYNMAECALYMDQTSTHPAGWKRVIDEFPKIRYCFAHFGSSGTWEKKNFHAYKYKDSPDLSKHSALLNEHRPKGRHLGDTNVFDAIGGSSKEVNQLSDWRRMISKCIKMPGSGAPGENVYTDISYYLMYHFSREEVENKPYYSSPTLKEFALRKVEKREQVADQLVEAMKDNKALLHKIIMGSDWYMTETATTGQGEYYKGMFLMLQYMSEKYEIGKHDLWHQFTVVNPMRFLGLIPDKPSETKQDKNGLDYYELNTEKILRFLGHLEDINNKKQDYKDWWKYAHISDEYDKKVDGQIKDMKKQFQNPDLFKIYTSEVMMARKENNIKDVT